MTITDITTGFGVLARADAFAATLTPEQRSALVRRRTPATLRTWSNYPQQVLGRRGRRVGLSTATLTVVQWAALDDLLTAAMGGGADRVRGHLAADDHLHDLGGRHGYGRGEFVVAFLDAPTCHGTWTLQFGGHHLAVAHTYRDGVLVGTTPSFRGIEPAVAFVQDGVRHEPERPAREALATLLASLDAGQRDRARLRGDHDDLLLEPGRDWGFPARHAGLPAAALSAHQRDLLTTAIAAWTSDVAEPDATGILARYTSELDDTHLGRCGTTGLQRVGDYVRIDGPSVWIEFSVQDGIVCAGPHPHAVWRDRVTDYGSTRF